MFPTLGHRCASLAALFVTLCVAASAHAQTSAAPGRSGFSAASARTVEMASRDTDGRLIIRAQPLTERLILDGRLDDPVYARHQPAGNFLQAEPHYGEPATEETQIWVFFDDRAIYVGIRCFDSDPQQWSSIDMRRDTPGTSQGETVTVALDTFNDKRNGYSFGVNPNGGISDAAITNERDYNRDWNTIWETRTGRFDGGWTVEMSIPFKSLRYAQGEQIWGINVRRTVRWKNEVSYLNPVPLGGQFSALFGLFRFSSAAGLVGLAAPPESRLFEVKPYGISSLKTDLDAAAPFSNKAAASFGVDTKVGVTRGLTA
ncbi:MAG TPA: carbohydrate binding family 9 domain-containing protein, partial [Vicinamibacterales bacterium]|nr:carbohydrate binding family 9 domain-containing protein [Vicinamibacterales bacterium]